MAVDFPSFTQEQLDQTARNLMRTRRRGIDVSYGSDWDLVARLIGRSTWLALEQSKVARRLLTKSGAFGDYLRQFAFEAGVGRDIAETTAAATRARGKVIIRSTTGSQTQLAGSVLRHQDGTEYTLDADVTTPATATKVLRAGLRSGRRRLFQGHAGGGFATAVAGEVYQFAATGEYCALKDVENGSALERRLFDLYVDLDADPEMHDQFVQQLGAVGSITASVAGAAGNKDSKDVLTVVSPSGTVVAEATIVYLTGGADEMSVAEKQGALQSLATTRQGVGTPQDIRALVLSYPLADIRECYVVPGSSGIGSYLLMPILADGQFVGANMLAEILAWVAARMDIASSFTGASVTEAVDADFDTLAVHVSTTYAPDWQLSDPLAPLEVTASTSSTLTLTAVDGIVNGSRVIVTSRGTSGPYVVQRRVTGIAALTISLDEPLPFPADVGDAFVTPGGPLGYEIIEAIYAAYEQQAPDSGGDDVVRLPLPTVPDGHDGILRSVSDVPGVTDADFTRGSPNTSVAAQVLVPGCIILMTVERA